MAEVQSGNQHVEPASTPAHNKLGKKRKQPTAVTSKGPLVDACEAAAAAAAAGNRSEATRR
eukprot:2031552-Pleurochrysis_carterae.AAC.1